jgi:two-component sensor histidine kinase
MNLTRYVKPWSTSFIMPRPNQSGDCYKTITLSVEDNGVGFPTDFDPQNLESLGWQLITLLSEQLEGQIQILQNDTTRVMVTFPELNYRKRL